VDWILVQTFGEASRINRILPENPWSAKQSISHTLATYLVLAEPGLAADDETAFSDESVRDVAGRIAVREDPELTLRTPTEWPARVTVRLHNGEELENTVLLPSGEFDTEPLSDNDIIEKFRKLAPESITGQAVDHIVDLAWQIESVADIKQITRLLTVDG
jgi:2-methylcitrate dehydratase PrpD